MDVAHHIVITFTSHVYVILDVGRDVERARQYGLYYVPI